MCLVVSATRNKSEYNGTVYEQTVVVTLPNGSELGLFDKDMLIDESMVGQNASLTIFTLAKEDDIEYTDKQEKKITPNPEQPRHWRGHEYWGKISHISDQPQQSYEVVVDIGVGEVIVYPRKRLFPELEVGDFLHITADRSDIDDVGAC